MFLNHICSIYCHIRTITSVIPTLVQKSFVKIKLYLKDFAHPSEGWGWGAVQPNCLKANKSLIFVANLVQSFLSKIFQHSKSS